MMSMIASHTKMLCLALMCMWTSAFSAQGKLVSEEGIIWEKAWKGKFDLYHPIDLSLRLVDGELEGEYSFPGTNLSFHLRGVIKDREYILQEIDEEGRVSGNLVLQVEDENLFGQWWSVDFTRSAPLKFAPRGIVLLKTFQPELLSLKGQSDNTDWELIVQKEADDQFAGSIWAPTKFGFTAVSGKCLDRACRKFSLQPADGQMPGMVCSDLASKPRLEIREPGSQVVDFPLQIEARYPLKIIHDAWYAGTLDAVYPTNVTPAFDTWIDRRVSAWVEQLRSHLANMAQDEMSAVLRQSITASLWVDIGIVSDELFSGLVTAYDINTGLYVRESFLFELKSDDSLDIRSQFRKDDALDVLLTEQIRSVRNGHKQAVDFPGYETWVNEAGFNHIFFRPDGLVAVTDFHPRFGEMTAVISYQEIRSELKSKLLRKTLTD